ncbi:hypothetical protein GCM10010531_18670 [Blastococcus jejuensis]|uniref:Uncharacterized protein n=1 Tax=Blastococcus jejuensis TaxID=351224 RepID=A0ABP6P3S3_9ACTN
MTEPQEYEAVFAISHAIFQLTDYDVVPEIGDNVGGLAVPLINGGAAVLCGISAGPVHVRAQVSATPPPPETAAWDEVAEIVFAAPTGSVRVTPLFEDPVPQIGVLTSGPGEYRLRVYARGRDTAPGRFVDTPTEDYLIQVWPEQPSR